VIAVLEDADAPGPVDATADHVPLRLRILLERDVTSITSSDAGRASDREDRSAGELDIAHHDDLP
jgi:hypothetical protein